MYIKHIVFTKDDNQMAMTSYVGISLHPNVVKRIDAFLETGFAKERGYVSRANLVVYLVNEFLEDLDKKSKMTLTDLTRKQILHLLDTDIEFEVAVSPAELFRNLELIESKEMNEKIKG